MKKTEAKELLSAFALYSHDEWGESISISIITSFLKFGFKDENLPLPDAFEKDLFKLINSHSKIGLSKPDLVKKMKWALGNCESS